ncbi:hypothetical protein [Bacillus sp. TH12]|uniref:hypothetical protein n=1 Tax=Bacillus sp. TH12 TaxID=2796378 RepID=UPI001911B089|nr:hypothetical protein [Bacillus sp. TH12]MBK5508136.1 hypothetical protein [Bacillus sp. TH12]
MKCPAILNEPLALLIDIQFRRLESPAISLSRSKQKALLGRELEVTWILNEPLVLLIFKKTKTGSCKMELALL